MPRRRREWPTIPIVPVLAYYGADLDDGYGDRWVPVKCPFHDDRSASASVNVEKGAFTCHACEMRGDAAKLVQLHEGLPSYREGADRAREIAGVPASQRQGKPRSTPAEDFW